MSESRVLGHTRGLKAVTAETGVNSIYRKPIERLMLIIQLLPSPIEMASINIFIRLKISSIDWNYGVTEHWVRVIEGAREQVRSEM